MIDTCQANTMYTKLYSPNIIATGSSELDQSSYSHHADNDVGVAVIDRYTYYNLQFLENEVRDLNAKKTVGDLFDSYDFEKIHSHAGVRYDLFPGGADAARGRLLTDFFGNVQNVEVDGSGRNGTLEEELVGIGKAMVRIREAAEAAEAAAKNKSKDAKVDSTAEVKGEQTAQPRGQKMMQFAKPLTSDDWWAKKALGATAVAGCVLIGAASRYLDAARR